MVVFVFIEVDNWEDTIDFGEAVIAGELLEGVDFFDIEPFNVLQLTLF
jgi:hypothetical protein